MAKALPVKHIGIVSALCDGRKRASLREDLGAERYRQLGVKERHVGESPYRICPKCIALVADIRKLMAVKRRRADRREARSHVEECKR